MIKYLKNCYAFKNTIRYKNFIVLYKKKQLKSKKISLRTVLEILLDELIPKSPSATLCQRNTISSHTRSPVKNALSAWKRDSRLPSHTKAENWCLLNFIKAPMLVYINLSSKIIRL